MEDLLYQHPDLLLGEPLKPVSRQRSSPVGRADLVFEHPNGYRLVVEVKAGVAPRGVGDQLHDYWGAEKAAHPNTPIEMMVVANEIPRERRLYLEKRDIDAREIPQKRFRDVAARVGYAFISEQQAEVAPQFQPVQEPGTQAESRNSPFEARDAASSDHGPRPALLMNLDTPQFKSLLRPESWDYLWLGTDSKVGKIPVDQIRYVYFKENRQKGTIEIGARAEFEKIGSPPDDPKPRLPGFENVRNLFYLKIRNLERLRNPIPIERLVGRRTRKSLGKSSQGVQLIDDPLPPA